MKQINQPDGSVTAAEGSSLVRVERLQRGVLLATMSGSGSEVLDHFVMAKVDREIAVSGRAILFVDMRYLSRIDKGTKDSAIPWLKAQRDCFEFNVLVRSKLVEMALSVMGMFASIPIRMYSNEDNFEAAIKRTCPGFIRLPTLRPARHIA